MALIWTEWRDLEDFDPEEAVRYREFAGEAAAAGVLVAGDSLHHASAATTVRVRDQDTMLTDGPFAETKEQISGYFVLECGDLDQALDWAAKIPGAKQGAIEVRPLLDITKMM